MKNGEIISYRDRDVISDKSLTLINREHHKWNMAVLKDFPIEAVSRRIDGRIFRLGTHCEQGVINSFHVMDDNIIATFFAGNQMPIEDLKTINTPLSKVYDQLQRDKQFPKISIIIENPESVSSDLADLLCWWQGFKAGLKCNPDGVQDFVADNGIDAARKLNLQIKDKINENKNS